MDSYMKTFRRSNAGHAWNPPFGLRGHRSGRMWLQGRMDAFYEYGLKSWDVAAGSFIVTEAGGNRQRFFREENNWAVRTRDGLRGLKMFVRNWTELTTKYFLPIENLVIGL